MTQLVHDTAADLKVQLVRSQLAMVHGLVLTYVATHWYLTN